MNELKNGWQAGVQKMGDFYIPKLTHYVNGMSVYEANFSHGYETRQEALDFINDFLQAVLGQLSED